MTGYCTYLGLSASSLNALEDAVRMLPAGTACSPVVEMPNFHPAPIGVVHCLAVALEAAAPLPDCGPDVTLTVLELGQDRQPASTLEPFLTALLHLEPSTVIGQRSLLEIAPPNRPLWMGILNITPDSFSDGGRWAGLDDIETTVTEWVEHGVHLIDIGAESTRPNAALVDPTVEWQRIEPVLDRLNDLFADRRLRPLLSLDSRNVATLERGAEAGMDVVNDVSGLDRPDICSFVAASNLPVIAMHAMSVPVVPTQILSDDISAVDHIEQWLERKQQDWQHAGIDLSRVIIDPGIGFGKTPAQSIELLANVERLRSHGHRVAMGHSRKSFMAGFAPSQSSERDPETLGISLTLARQGADIIRVHDPLTHLRAHRAASQIGRHLST